MIKRDTQREKDIRLDLTLRAVRDYLESTRVESINGMLEEMEMV